MNDHQMLQQRRAKHALQSVQNIGDSFDPDTGDEYKRWADKLASIIVNAGLGQACALLLSKGNDKSAGTFQMYSHLQQWLTSSAYRSPYRDDDDLIEAIVSHDQESYLHAQAEALAWLEWTKKFANAFLSEAEATP